MRYQWVTEMCCGRRTESDLVGMLIGFTDSAFSANESAKRKNDEWDWIPLSMAYMSTVTAETERTVQRAVKWLKEHGILESREQKRTNGSTAKSAYRLNLELLDKVVEYRDMADGPVHLEIDPQTGEIRIVRGLGKVAPVSGVTKCRVGFRGDKMSGGG